MAELNAALARLRDRADRAPAVGAPLGPLRALRLPHVVPQRSLASARRVGAPRGGHRDAAVLLADHRPSSRTARGASIPPDTPVAADLVARGLYVSAAPDLTRTTARSSPRRSPRWRGPRARADAHLLTALRDRARVRLGGRGLRAGAPEGPGRARGPERHPARAGQAPSARRQGLDDPPRVAAQGAAVVRDPVRVAALRQAALGRRGVRHAPRALGAVRRARRALGPAALPACPCRW